MSTLRRFAADSRGATALEYGIIGGVVAFLAGAVFLHVAPSLADMAAYAVRSLSGAHRPAEANLFFKSAFPR